MSERPDAPVRAAARALTLAGVRMGKFRLADLFGPPKRPDPEAELERQLRALEQEALHALPGFGAQFLNRAGDLCLEAGKLNRGLSYLGGAIDMYLHAGRWDAAGAVCRKLLRVSPNAVRARCTLAWLSIGKSLGGEAQARIRDYVRAAQTAGAMSMEMAKKQLALMAEAARDEEVLRLLAEQLRQLGGPEAAARVDARLKEVKGPAAADHDEEQVWSAVLRAALLGPRQLSQ